MDAEHRRGVVCGACRPSTVTWARWAAAGILLLAALAVSAACRTAPGPGEAEAQRAGAAREQHETAAQGEPGAVGTTGAAPGTPATAAPTMVPAGRMREFSVTAYCTGRVTQSGARVKAGMAAADPRVLPVGSTVRVEGQGTAYDGIYTVTDTGREIKGRELDLYIDRCAEAERFGRRSMGVAVIRKGWDPDNLPGKKTR